MPDAANYHPDMQVETRLALSVSTLAFVIMACVILLLWTAQRSAYNHQSSSHAYEELGAYLQLTGEVFRTFKKVRSDLIRKDGALTFDIENAKTRLDATIAKIWNLQLEEFEMGFQSGDNSLETSRLESIRKHLNAVFMDIKRALELIESGEAEQAHELLNKSLLVRIDAKVGSLVEIAVTDERGELSDALAEIEWINRFVLWASVAAGIIGLVLTSLVIYTLASGLGTGLRHLEVGAETFAVGDLRHRIPVEGGNEFAKLALGFNTMARQLLDQREAIEQARNSLERRVEERTEELHAANTELRRHDQSRRQFFADIGHELRSPITAVRGEAEVALRARDGAEEIYKAALSRIVNITDQLTRFVNDIFLIAREQAGVADMRRSVIDLRMPIRDAADQMRTVLAEQDANLMTILPEKAALIEGDDQRLCQLVQVLVTNAVQHSQPGVTIRITLRHDAFEWTFRVEDDGPGISKKHAAHAFERFYRGDGVPDKSHMRNTGLGLPIARSIANSHGGRIWIDTAYTNGTAVCVAIPDICEQLDAEADEIEDQRAELVI